MRPLSSAAPASSVPVPSVAEPLFVASLPEQPAPPRDQWDEPTTAYARDEPTAAFPAVR